MRTLVLASLTLANSPMAQELLLEDQHRMTPAESRNDLALAAADLDGDGDTDLLVCPEDATPYVRLNDGAGSFREAPGAVPAEFPPAVEVALADVDGDGDTDAYLLRQGVAKGLLANDGSGTFSDRSADLPGLGEWTSVAAFADVDGDGDPDLLLGNWAAEPDGLRRNDGTGVFTDASSNVPALPLWTNDLAVGDVDADGDLDYVTVNGVIGFNRKGRLFVNDGQGVFTDTPQNFPAVPMMRRAVDLGDVDGDGDLDYVASSSGLGVAFFPKDPIEVLLNDGAGVFSPPPADQPLVAEPAQEFVLADVDGDGDEDLIAAYSSFFSAPSARAYEAEGGNLTEVPDAFPLLEAVHNDVAVADFDGDGDLDAVFACAGQDRVFLNDGQGAFATDGSRLSENVRERWDVLAEDFDGDGFPDLLFAQSLAMFRGDGTGSFDAAGTLITPATSSVRHLAAGDVDEDGDSDVLIASGAMNSLHLNDGAGGFGEARGQLPTNSNNCRDVAMGDLDGDGDLDAAFVQDQPEGDYFQRNDGAGNFGPAIPFDLDTNQNTDALVLGDLNGDGALDVVIVGAFTPHLLLGDGLGGWVEDAAAFPGVEADVEVVALGDVDGDGDRDALFDSMDTEAQLFENDGSAAFVEVTDAQLGSVEYMTGALAFADLDLDGDLDVLLGAGGFGFQEFERNTVLVNDGSGTFTDEPELLPDTFGTTRAVAVSDFDRDGDLDVAVANDEYLCRVLTNRLRSLARRGIPRVGQPLSLELSGPPGTVWFLAVAPEDFLLPLPPYGLLRLDPFLAVPLGLGVLDTEGRAELQIFVPDDPTLVGVDYFWQAVVGAPLRLTNLERTTFTAF